MTNMWILIPKDIYNQNMWGIYIGNMWKIMQVYYTLACEYLFTI